MDLVNLVVGLLAILVSVVGLILSYNWNKEARDALSNAQSTLADTKHTLRAISDKSQEIHQSIEQRVSDLIKRAIPTGQEQVMNKAMEQLFGTFLSNPELLKWAITESGKQQKPNRN